MGHAIKDISAHLKSRIIITDSGCWEWQGCRTKSGYGCFTSKNKYTHRAAFEEWNGPIPVGLCVCHKCDNPPCINPSHLFLGTHKDNLIDAAKKGKMGRLKNKFNKEQIYFIRASPRTNSELAAIFKTSPTAISNVKTRTYYAYWP